MTSFRWAAVASFVLLVLSLLLPSKDSHHKPLQPHHGYLGSLLMLLPGWPVFVVGAIIWTDDFLQHLIQTWDPGFRSPIHCLRYYKRCKCRGL